MIRNDGNPKGSNFHKNRKKGRDRYNSPLHNRVDKLEILKEYEKITKTSKEKSILESKLRNSGNEFNRKKLDVIDFKKIKTSDNIMNFRKLESKISDNKENSHKEEESLENKKDTFFLEVCNAKGNVQN